MKNYDQSDENHQTRKAKEKQELDNLPDWLKVLRYFYLEYKK